MNKTLELGIKSFLNSQSIISTLFPSFSSFIKININKPADCKLGFDSFKKWMSLGVILLPCK